MSAKQVQLRKQGFTLIEMLLAMFILFVIVMVVSRMFQQCSLAWESGSRKAELNMTGRSMADFIAQELGRAVADKDVFGFDLQPDQATFWVLGAVTNPPNERVAMLQKIEYLSATKTIGRTVWAKDMGGYYLPSNMVSLGVVRMAPAQTILALQLDPDPLYAPPDLPTYVDITVQVIKPEDLLKPNPPLFAKTYKSRAYLVNRNRYKYD
jgi:prepilin-type N-terminal cleavage/methylation domain-containing protein